MSTQQVQDFAEVSNQALMLTAKVSIEKLVSINQLPHNPANGSSSRWELAWPVHLHQILSKDAHLLQPKQAERDVKRKIKNVTGMLKLILRVADAQRWLVLLLCIPLQIPSSAMIFL